ncbi:MAG: hypothetical protein V3V08_00985 [Nannocystaceae bacterium]
MEPLEPLAPDEPVTGDIELEEHVGGQCSEWWPAMSVLVELALSDDALPWQDFLMFQTYMDGVPWNPQHEAYSPNVPEESWEGRGRDLIYARCEGDETHVLEMEIRARLSGHDLELGADLALLVLRCSATDNGDTAKGDTDAKNGTSDGDALSDGSRHAGGCGCTTARATEHRGCFELTLLSWLGLFASGAQRKPDATTLR